MKCHVKFKIIIILFSCFLFILQFAAVIQARVAGDCEACHALYPGMMEKVKPDEPPQYVLRNVLCVNCHTSNNRDTIKVIGGVNVPVILNQVKPVKPLAGGNFYYVAGDFGNRKGHNVEYIASMDPRFQGLPPGYNRKSDPSIIGYDPKKPLACSGSNGCHGDRNIKNPVASIMGTHHAVDFPLDGSTTAKSYRYLKNTSKVKGVPGFEDDEWDRNSSSIKHNEYSIKINELCTSCHGDFHGAGQTGKKSPWFRHPTGIPLPKKGEYLMYNPDIPPPPEKTEIRIYSVDAPVSRAKVPSSSSDEVKPGIDLVSCLSCHVAHASPYESGLRWDYDSFFTGEGGQGGCFICHTEKRE